jgi:hypothetical protein
LLRMLFCSCRLDAAAHTASWEVRIIVMVRPAAAAVAAGADPSRAGPCHAGTGPC